MKRTLHKITSAVLAGIMLIGCLSFTALAAGTTPSMTDTANGHTLTVNGTQTGHKYVLYQVFSGKWDDESGTLSNVEWGVSIKNADSYDLSSKLVAALLDGTNDTLHNTFKTELTAANPTAADVAGVLSENDAVKTAACLDEFAQIISNLITAQNATGTAVTSRADASANDTTYTFSNVADGYYIISEDVGQYTPGKDDKGNDIVGNFTRFIVQVVDDAAVTPKTDGTPDLGKTIAVGDESTQPVNDLVTSDDVTKDDAAIGDTVYFNLSGNVPEMKYYNSYYYIINDTMSKGLTFGKIETIKVGDNVLADATGVGTDTSADAYIDADGALHKDGTTTTMYYTYATTSNSDGTTGLKIVFHDFIQYEQNVGAQVIVHYSASLNENAVIGNVGNPNDVQLTYSNNPNYDYDGKDEPGPDSNAPVGVTPKSEVIVYTTSVLILKTNESGALLNGAEFQLKGDGVNTTLVISETFDPVSYVNYAVSGVTVTDSNYYELLAAKTGDPNTFTTTAPTADTLSLYAKEVVHFSYDGAAYNPDPSGTYIKTTANDNSYMLETEYDALTGDELAAAGDKVTDIAVLAKTVSTNAITADAEQTNVIGVTNADGRLTFSGLPAGEYTITETEAPAGYNLLSDSITVKITFTASADDVWSYVTSGAASDYTMLSDNTIQLNVVNVAGSTLPTTGGIGTTIFYVVGACLVVGAAVVLISKKRMSDAEF